MLGKNIKYLRQKRRLSQAELAERLGYTSATTVYKWENGENRPRMNSLLAVCRFFDVSVDELTNVDLEARDMQKEVTVSSARALPVLAKTIESEAVTQSNYDRLYFVDERVHADFCVEADEDVENIAIGDFVLCKHNFELKDGKLYAVHVKGDKHVLIRYITRQDNFFILTPEAEAVDESALQIVGECVGVVHMEQL